MIPKRIIHFWHDRESLPDITRQAIENTRKIHHDYEFIFADDDFMFDHIQQHYGQGELRLYRKMLIPQSRSDLARLMLLYHFGGVYMDCSVHLHKPLGTLIEAGDEIILVRRDDDHASKRLPERAQVINRLMCARPKTDFFKWCVNKSINNLIDGDFNTRLVQCAGAGVVNVGLYKLRGNHNFTFWNYSELNNGFLSNTRAPGINNNWLEQQQSGIIDTDYLRKNSGRFERTFSFRKKFFHISLSFLSLGDGE